MLSFGIGKKSVFKFMKQGTLKFQGLKDLGHGLLSNCQKFTCTQFVGAIYEKLDQTSLNEVSRVKAATKVLSTGNSFHFHILHSTRPPHKMNTDKRYLNTLMTHILYATPTVMYHSAAAPKILNDLTCNCQNSFCGDNCTSYIFFTMNKHVQ